MPTELKPAALTRPPLTALYWKALEKASKKNAEETRDQLTVANNQPIDFAIRIKGYLNVAPRVADAEETISPDAEDLLAIVLLAVGPPSRERIIAAIHQAYGTIASDERKPEVDPGLHKIASELVACAKLKRAKPKNGNVTGTVEVFEITDIMDTYFNPPPAPQAQRRQAQTQADLFDTNPADDSPRVGQGPRKRVASPKKLGGPSRRS